MDVHFKTEALGKFVLICLIWHGAIAVLLTTSGGSNSSLAVIRDLNSSLPAADCDDGVNCIADAGGNRTTAASKTSQNGSWTLPTAVAAPRFSGDDSSPRWSTWCPESYRNNRVGSVLFSLCTPRSCALIGDLDVLEGVGQWMRNLTVDITTVSVTLDGTNATLCLPLSAQFSSCNLSYLLPGEYDILANGSLWNKVGRKQVPLGDYFRQSDRAVVCAAEAPARRKQVRTPCKCTSYVVRQTGFRFERSNRSVYIDGLEQWIEPGYFELEDNGTAVHFCYKTNFPSCQFGNIERVHTRLQPDFSMLVTSGVTPEFSVGTYFYFEDGSFAVYCSGKVSPTRSKQTRYLFASAGLVSSICLLLVLLAHMFFPRLNYHAKSLLCHAFSLFVMYLTLSVRYFSGTSEYPAANAVAFSFQYVFSLSAFFWLSVLGFDLWRIFSKLQGTINPGGNQGKKRWFFAKSVYAWGIPVLLCIMVLALVYTQKSDEFVGMNFESNEWFVDVTDFYYFYAPIAVLLTANLVFFILTVINIRRASSGTDILMSSGKSTRKLFRVYAKIFVVMGLTWFAEIISSALREKTSEVAWYVFDLINCLQGVLIFVVYVCKRKTFITIKSRFGCDLAGSSESTQTTTSKKSDTVLAMTTVSPPKGISKSNR